MAVTSSRASGMKPGSGSVVFDNVLVAAQDVIPFQSAFERPTPVGPLAQILHAAIDTGIARAAFEDALPLTSRAPTNCGAQATHTQALAQLKPQRPLQHCLPQAWPQRASSYLAQSS